MDEQVKRFELNIDIEQVPIALLRNQFQAPEISSKIAESSTRHSSLNAVCTSNLGDCMGFRQQISFKE